MRARHFIHAAIIFLISLVLLEIVLQAATRPEIYNRFPKTLQKLAQTLHNEIRLDYHLAYHFKRRIAKTPTTMGFSINEPHPTRGWWPKPNLDRAEAFGVRYSTNRFGHRTLFAEYDRPVDALVLGDSFTFGVDAEDEDAWTHRLAVSLPGANIVNLGMGGFGVDQMLITLREEIDTYDPKLILVCFISADLMRASLSFRDFSKPRFELRDGELVETGEFVTGTVSEVVEKLESELKVLRAIFSIRTFHMAYSLITRLRLKLTSYDLNARLVEEIAALARSRRVPVLFVYFPYLEEATDASLAPEPGEQLLEELRVRGFDVVNFRTFFLRHPDPAYNFRSHYTQPLTKAVADVLRQKVREMVPQLPTPVPVSSPDGRRASGD